MISTIARVRLAENLGREVLSARRQQARGNVAAIFEAMENIHRAFSGGQLSLRDVSLSALWDTLVNNGREIRESITRYGAGAADLLYEASAVQSSDFQFLMMRMLSGEVLAKFDSVDLIQDQLSTVMQTSFRSERIPGIGGLGDVVQEIGEGMPYPLAGVGADFVDTPRTKKRGIIIPVTREAVFFDQTGVLLDRCDRVAEAMLLSKEKRIISVAVGATNNFNYRGTAYNTYQNGGALELYDNTAASNPFANWISLQTSETLHANMTDPMTGQPINITSGKVLLAGSIAVRDCMQRIVGATEIRETSNSGNLVTIGKNPKTGYTVLYSPFVATYAGNGTSWFQGNFKSAFKYFQNWGIETDRAGAASDEGFNNDIIFKAKVSEMAEAGVYRPWEVIKNDA